MQVNFEAEKNKANQIPWDLVPLHPLKKGPEIAHTLSVKTSVFEMISMPEHEWRLYIMHLPPSFLSAVGMPGVGKKYDWGMKASPAARDS